MVSQKPTVQTKSEKIPPKIDGPSRNKTNELEGLDMSNIPKVEETKNENSNLTTGEGEKKVEISSQNIHNILIGRHKLLKMNSMI